MSSQQPSPYGPFTESTAAAAVKSACGEIGVPPPIDLELLRIGENALFAEPAQGLDATLQAVDRAALRRDRTPLPTWHGTHRLLAHELGGSILNGTPVTTSLPPLTDPRPAPSPAPSPPPARQSAER
jgi:hypothetical protein